MPTSNSRYHSTINPVEVLNGFIKPTLNLLPTSLSTVEPQLQKPAQGFNTQSPQTFPSMSMQLSSSNHCPLSYTKTFSIKPFHLRFSSVQSNFHIRYVNLDKQRQDNDIKPISISLNFSTHFGIPSTAIVRINCEAIKFNVRYQRSN